MYLVAIAWMYVVLMAAVVEAISTDGTVLGAVMTFVFFGLLPLAIVMYLLGTPSRRRARRARESADPADSAGAGDGSASVDPDGRSHPAGDALAPERKEP